MIFDSYGNFRLRGKYISAVRMLELQGIIGYSFIPNLTDRMGAYFLYTITAVRQGQCTDRLRDVHVG